ncbi:conjugal transfer protein TraG [Arachidicoccus ginsenosidimutans]|uniref:conjugal transfer protein MobC n=1 Tax=Arachidicoccus sp. BS20 TaxID=1850526 RepID=UPI0007F0F8CA|nr:conjugal transfer protein MobC [Arachidicoccus sp. BS20]ANI89240.1 conjugal transfer protein TraG [Arachidicoccus sp. BS20]
MSTGENEQGLRSIMDLTRLVSIAVLLIHFYVYCHVAFEYWHLTAGIVDKLMLNFNKLPAFQKVWKVKVSVLGLLAVFLAGVKGRKDEKISIKTALAYLIPGMILFFVADILLYAQGDVVRLALFYMGMTSIGYLLTLTGGAYLSRILKVKLAKDIFNLENETFPQEERLLENEFSVNLPAKYNLKGKVHDMWLNIINAARLCIIIGSPGAGKTFFLVREIIKQTIEKKQFSALIYDFKYDDLAKIAYNSWLKSKHLYTKTPGFFIINFDEPVHRCNPLEPALMNDITDASESARTILLGLNMDWIKKQGDFFVESPINFTTAIIWYLKKYKDGIYCTLPHAIEMMQMNYTELFPVLASEPEIEVLVNPFITAFQNKAMEQLEGQTASAKIALARLSSPLLYYVLSGNDFSLDINNPDDPKIVVLANNPEKTQIYGAVVSLYLTRLFRILPKKGKMKSVIIADEFSSIFANGIENFLAIARGYKINTYLAIQNLQQLRKNYGKEQADVLFALAGNIFCGQATGETAKEVSETIGKIVQTRESISINANDTSLSKSTQLDLAVPPAKIAKLSSGEFVGVLADNPNQQLSQKAFHCTIQNNPDAINVEEVAYKSIPKRKVENIVIQNNFIQIKNDIIRLIDEEMEKIRSNPKLSYLLMNNKPPNK